MQDLEDDGGLGCLSIPRNEQSRSFNCERITQGKLVNTTFWVVDYLEDIPTRYSRQKGKAGQTLVKIKLNREDAESETKKFFTGSEDILYILQKVREMNKFPRRVTLRCNGNRFFFE